MAGEVREELRASSRPRDEAYRDGRWERSLELARTGPAGCSPRGSIRTRTCRGGPSGRGVGLHRGIAVHALHIPNRLRVLPQKPARGRGDLGSPLPLLPCCAGSPLCRVGPERRFPRMCQPHLLLIQGKRGKNRSPFTARYLQKRFMVAEEPEVNAEALKEGGEGGDAGKVRAGLREQPLVDGRGAGGGGMRARPSAPNTTLARGSGRSARRRRRSRFKRSRGGTGTASG